LQLVSKRLKWANDRSDICCVLQVAASAAYRRAAAAAAQATADYAASGDCVQAFQTAAHCRKNANMVAMTGAGKMEHCSIHVWQTKHEHCEPSFGSVLWASILRLLLALKHAAVSLLDKDACVR
jgi:hypothetical protein